MSNGSMGRRGVPLPVIRHFVPCQKIERWQDGQSNSLIRVIHRLGPGPGGYPRKQSELWLYVVIVEGRGSYTFQVTLERFEDPPARMQWPPTVLAVGPPPTQVVEWPIPLKGIEFAFPGTYTFRLYCEGREVASVPIELEGDA